MHRRSRDPLRAARELRATGSETPTQAGAATPARFRRSSDGAPRHRVTLPFSGIGIGGIDLTGPLALLALAALLVAPLSMVIFSSFRLTLGFLPFEAGATWTINNYVEIFLDGRTYAVAAATLIFAGASIAIAFVISTLLAWLVERSDMPLRRTIYILVVAAVGMPGVIVAIAWAILLNPRNGLINVLIRDTLGLEGTGPLDIYTLPGLIFAEALSITPVMFLLIAPALRAVDPSIEEAAAASGASRVRTLWRITLPVLKPALLAALIYQFVTVIGSFDVPLVLGLRAGVQLLSTEIFADAAPSRGIPNYGLASTYSVLFFLISLGPLLVYSKIISRAGSYVTVSSRGYRARKAALGRWRLPAIGFAMVVIAGVLILPASIIWWMSVQPFYRPPSLEALQAMSLDAYGRMLGSPSIRQAFVNTFIVGVATAGTTMLLGLVIGWLVVRSRSRLRVVVDVLAFLPHTIPGVIIGLSVLLFYLLLPLPLYGTLWIIVIGLTTQLITIATRLMTGGIVQIDRQLEDAAAASGAGRTTTLGRVVLPLLWPAFAGGLILVLLLSIKHLTVPLMLLTPDTFVLSSVLWSHWEHGDTMMAGALGFALVLLTVALGPVVRRGRGLEVAA